MSANQDNPLRTAGQQYREIHKVAKKFATAADQHPQIPYSIEESYNFDQINQELTEHEAESDLQVLSYFLSQQWDDAQEYFMFDFERQLDQERRQRAKGLTQDEEEAATRLKQKYEELERTIQNLSDACDRLLDKTPKDRFGKYTLEPKTQFSAASD